jgi:hypothetical protein
MFLIKNHKEKLEQKFTFSIAHSRLQYQFKKMNNKHLVLEKINLLFFVKG